DNPTAYLVGKAREKRIILIGTHHRNAYIHNLITSSLPSLVKDAGINTLFVEIPTSQQQVINQFCAGKVDVENINISEIVTSPSYREVLKQARTLKMSIIAIDTEIPAPICRDEWMSKQVITYMQGHPKDKGIVVVGARHVLKGVEWTYSHAPSLADYLKDYSIFSVVPWPNALETTLPVAMDITPLKFGGVRTPLLNSMNIQPSVSLASVADGIILLPRSQ
ncbi:MAG TPA: hypothetical protein PLA83_11505, partial [Deltaproteobacteria bacterium]|nr:hypothetical protein [Deltaproteobacteria bacterium]